MASLDDLMDQQAGGPAPAPARFDPLDAAMDDHIAQQRQRLAGSLTQGVVVNPDTYAGQIRDAKTLGYPTKVLDILPDLAARAKAQRVQDDIAQQPVLQKKYSEEDFAKLAHDDSFTLSSIGKAISAIGGSMKAGVYNASRGAAGVFASPLEMVAPALDFLEPVTAIGGNPVRRLAEGFRMLGGTAGEVAKAARPNVEGNVARGFFSGIESLTQNVMNLPALLVNPAAGLTGMVAPVAGNAYLDAREKGIGPMMASLFGMSQGSIEYATEKIPALRLLGDVKAGTSFLKTLGRQIAREVPGEQVATVLQDLNEWAVLNPEKPFSEYLAERPDAFVQTLVATIVGTGGNVAVIKGIDAAMRRLEGQDRALLDGQALADALKAAGQSKLLERSPEQFREVLNQMGGDAEVRFDARLLLEQASPEQLVEAMPSLAPQLADAQAAGAEVRVPVGEFISGVVGTPLEQSLRDYARLGENELSLAEAKDAAGKAEQFLTQQAERVIQQAQDQAAMRAAHDEVKAGIQQQLDSVGRFSKQVNEAYATFSAAFYTTMAGRMGMTPQQMAARYPLRIVGQTGAGQVMDQDVEQDIGDLLRESGQRVINSLDAERRFASGERLFAVHEQDEDGEPTPINSVEELRNWAPDQLLALPMGVGETLEQAAIPNENEVDRQQSLGGARISPRSPTAKKATEDSLGDTRLQPDLETAKRDPEAFSHNIELMVQYPNFEGLQGTADDKAEVIIKHAVDNLLWLHDHWKSEYRNRSKLWYVGGNRISHRWADQFNVTPEQVAAVIAATSPQKDWFQNVSLAERILEAVVYNSEVKWDSKMSDLVRTRDWGPKAVPDPSVYEGKSLRDLFSQGTPGALLDMSIWIRAWDEANNPQVARVITPEGGFADRFDAGKTGKPVALRWQSFPTIVKTLQVLMNPDRAALSEIIGANHKVRSFYNNIIAPYAGEDVTIDTHAVAAALLRPLGSSDTEVFHNFGSGVPGSPGPKNSAITGLYGTYAIYAEAYRRAAAERGILPREMQSITWEAVRGLFRPEQKNERIKAAADQLWRSAAQGEISAEQARQQIEQLVGGIADPAWVRSPAGKDEARADSSYASELPEARRAGGSARPRAGVDAASGTESGGQGVLEQGPLGTFNPATLELALNPNANLSTFLHESGHFFLEVMADLASQPNAPAGIVEDMNKILAWFGIKGDEAVGGADSGVPLGQSAQQTETLEFKRWFGNSKVVDVEGKPLVVYHGTLSGGFSTFKPGSTGTFGDGIYFSKDADTANFWAGDREADMPGESEPGGSVYPVYVNIRNPASEDVAAEVESIHGSNTSRVLQEMGYDGVIAGDEIVAFRPEQIKSAIGNDGTFDADDRSSLSQGHQPAGPTQPVKPKRTPLETWQSMTLDQKRPYHERFAESIEQYLMEGKAPSVELQPVFQRFRSWLLRVYKSIKDFLAGRGVATGEGETLGQAAFHGTPHRGIDKFSTDFIGTGEGVAAYGWGLYFASKRAVAEFYRKSLTGGGMFTPFEKGGRTIDTSVDLAEVYYQPGRIVRSFGGADKVLEFKRTDNAGWMVKVVGVRANGEPMASERPRWHSTFPDQAQLRDVLEGDGWTRKEAGQLYEVDVPESDELLDWDKPLSQQPAKVREALEAAAQGDDVNAQVIAANFADDSHGADLYKSLGADVDDSEVSQFLASIGIKGLQYLDATSRRANRDSHNYVIFSGDDVQIRNQFYQGQQPTGLNIQLNDEIRGVFDRMLASEEQIAQAEEVAGMLPDEKATQDAIDKLTARSLRDMKWLANARSKAIKALQKQAAALRKEVQVEVTAEVDAMPEFAADAELKRIRKANKAAPTDAEMAVVADAFGFPDVDTMLKAIDAVGKRADVIEGLTDQRMLERHGDLVDQRAIEEAANAAIHNDARARVLATELKAQAELLGARTDTGETNSAGNAITVNTLKRAAELFAANVVDRTQLRHLKRAAWDHTSAERRAAKAWQAATAAGKTQEAVQAKQDQFLNNAAAKAALEAQQEVVKIRDFFARVVKGNNEKTVERGRDPDLVNAARAILTAYGVQSPASKGALEYLEVVKRNDPDTFAAVEQGVAAALANPRPLDTLTIGELRALRDEIDTIWTMAKRSRQMEVDGDLMDIEDAEAELRTRLEDVPNVIPGELSAMTPAEQAQRGLQFAVAIGRRVESWAEALDGKWGGPFTRLVFGPIKTAADKFRTARIDYRKRFQTLVDNLAPAMRPGLIEAPELGYTFGKGHNGMGVSELLHAILHTGNDSNKRKLLLGRGWATENPDGTLDTARWDAFLKRMTDTGVLEKAHYDFAQGVWDLLEDTKTLAQRAHRDVFGRYFDEVTAQPFDTPFGSYRGGYVPAQADTRIVTDAALRQLADMENQNMAFSFPTTAKGFTKSRTEYNRPLVLDLRTIPQHIDKVLMFSYLEPAVRDVNRLIRRKGISQPLSRIQPAAYEGMLVPWLNRSARQQVETPIVGDGRVSRVLSTVRQRAGMALMFGNISNTLQQITGLSGALVKVGPGNMMGALATYLSSPKKTAQQVADSSAYMRDRMQNEIAAMNDAMNDILLNPTAYESAQAWTQKHAYFLQSAFDNVLSPIVWTGAYNQALKDGMTEAEAVKFADSTVRQTQGSTLPEDVSRIETGPAYARVFTQFVSYFNMMANTNGTALLNIAREVGLKKGAGKALYVVTMGLLVPLWVAEAIAIAFRGGPEDEDRDGEYLDDWLAAVMGFGTIKGMFAMIPFVGQAANVAINKMNDNPADDRASLSPAVSLLEAGVGAPISVYKAIADDGSAQKAVRDVASLVSIATGLPATFVARPVGYLTGVADDRIEPTSELDFARGVVTGTASPESKNR